MFFSLCLLSTVIGELKITNYINSTLSSKKRLYLAPFRILIHESGTLFIDDCV